MLSEIEKILILRTVRIFSETPDDALVELAKLMEEEFLPADRTIFHKGDMGDCMYIIVEGKVKVHDGEHFLNFLGKRDVFGELAVLDAEARSASVTAVEDTQLLRIDQQALYRLMSTHIEVAQGIIHVLCQHVRTRVRESTEDFLYMQQFARVTAAAAAVEAGIFEPESLDEVAARIDALGQLARVFQRMTREVAAREQHLRRQVEELRIEIDYAKQARMVSEITEGDAFLELQRKARALRSREHQPPPTESPSG